MNEAAERLGIEPDNAALPELGRRTDSGQGVADLMRYTCQQLAQCGQAFTPPQLDLQPVALGRLAADGPGQPGGEAERQGDTPERQARGQSITLERAVDEERIDQTSYHPGCADAAPVDHQW